ncbi:glycosyltransferase family 1 protein [Adhaeribacter arboris]|uniref:Glycosyltransferase family 1 protein n=1 Tax=Adhaeribacter arboris TaxID=2072846 RepID=A0A2T2YAC5_9BACT|nr:glycosyltransferase family 1 protein [Adhaeribacter arboris]PSR52480.1 glycosyltransferase family 1 protein [Adhaeribacter arboris]
MKRNDKPLMVIDARLIDTSGIGTVCQNVIPLLKSKFDIILLGKRAVLQQFSWIDSIQIIEFATKIYSLKEQLDFFSKIPLCDYFLSPHYNVPLLPIRAKKRITIIHDVNHIALAANFSIMKRLYAKWILASALKLSDIIFTVSSFSKSEIVKFFGVKEDRINTIPLGVDKSIFKTYSISEKQSIQIKYKLPEKFILYVGNVKPHKNLITLIKAFALLKAESFGEIDKLVIVGKKEGFITNDLNLDNEIERLQLRDAIIFTGFVESQDLPVIYNLADLFVFPSFYEGYGLPPIEAMACGCPVLVSNVSSLPEVCKEAALYFNPYDLEELAQSIHLILNDKLKQEELRTKGFYLTANYNWQNTANRMEEIILTN